MGLPQELVDYTISMLQDDLLALKACSLTCKSMFASSRYLVHQTLCLNPRNNKSVLTREEKKNLVQQGWIRHNIELRFLSYMGEHDFLKYTRRIYIGGFNTFDPVILIPHFRHFQSLDQVHTLIVEHYNALSWESLSKTCFSHLYPTLTSLTLTRPFGHYRTLLEFVLQFPHLQNLGFEWLRNDQWIKFTSPIAGKFPPLRGHLRLAFSRDARWPRELVRQLEGGIKFRSLELESTYFWDHGHHLLAPFTETLEDLTVVTDGQGTLQLFFLSFKMRRIG